MARLTRRDFAKCCLAAAAAPALPAMAAPQGIQQGPVVGRVRARAGREIAASPLSVGFETLDRRMFQPERTYEHLGALGVKWARVQTGWARCETEPGRYDFAWLDEIVDSILRVGVQPWFNLGYGNRLYTPEAPDPTAVGWVPLASDEARQGWLRFVRALAQHFRTRVRHWEIWNEPNIKMFWKPGTPSPEGYAELARMTAPEIRARVPGAVLIGGALSHMPTEYLTRCLELGLAEHVDRISYHPYDLLPEKNYAPRVAQWRTLLMRYKPSLALWQGECGCPSREGGVGALSRYRWNEQRQARWLLRRTLCDLSLGLELVSYFHLVDLVRYSWAGMNLPKDARDSGAYFGLLRGNDYSAKPSYGAYQTLCALFDAQTKVADMRLEVSAPAGCEDGVHQATFVRHGHPLVAYWCADDVQNDTPPRPVDLALATNSLKLTAPVLVDPLSGEARRIEGTQTGADWRWPGLPLSDYPMLLTDAGVL